MTVPKLSDAYELFQILREKLPVWGHGSCREALAQEMSKFHRAAARVRQLEARVEELERELRLQVDTWRPRFW
jgi:hypothetical protein